MTALSSAAWGRPPCPKDQEQHDSILQLCSVQSTTRNTTSGSIASTRGMYVLRIRQKKPRPCCEQLYNNTHFFDLQPGSDTAAQLGTSCSGWRSSHRKPSSRLADAYWGSKPAISESLNADVSACSTPVLCPLDWVESNSRLGAHLLHHCAHFCVAAGRSSG